MNERGNSGRDDIIGGCWICCGGVWIGGAGAATESGVGSCSYS